MPPPCAISVETTPPCAPPSWSRTITASGGAGARTKCWRRSSPFTARRKSQQRQCCAKITQHSTGQLRDSSGESPRLSRRRGSNGQIPERNALNPHPFVPALHPLVVAQSMLASDISSDTLWQFGGITVEEPMGEAGVVNFAREKHSVELREIPTPEIGPE